MLNYLVANELTATPSKRFAVLELSNKTSSGDKSQAEDSPLVEKLDVQARNISQSPEKKVIYKPLIDF